MAEKTKIKRPGGAALDLPMALFAAGSVAFAAFAMPADLFGSLVSATGLPGVLPAAQPPLGGTARLAFVLGSAGVTFGLVWSLLRALGRPRAVKPVEAPTEAPRLRRADMHPDAPARAPIRAGSDLGVPLDSVDVEQREAHADLAEVENVDFEAEWERPAPSFLTPAAEAEPVTPEVEPDAAEVPFWVPESAEAAEEQPDAAAEPSVVAYWPVEAEPAGPQAEAGVDQLVTRLEGGLIRRKRDGARRPARLLDSRLRGALDDLNTAARRR